MAVLWISLVIVLIDQLTKLAVKGSPWAFLPLHGMPYGSSQPLIGEANPDGRTPIRGINLQSHRLVRLLSRLRELAFLH